MAFTGKVKAYRKEPFVLVLVDGKIRADSEAQTDSGPRTASRDTPGTDRSATTPLAGATTTPVSLVRNIVPSNYGFMKAQSGLVTSVSYSLQNKLHRSVGHVTALVILYDKQEKPLHSEHHFCGGPIPPRLAKRCTLRFYSEEIPFAPRHCQARSGQLLRKHMQRRVPLSGALLPSSSSRQRLS